MNFCDERCNEEDLLLRFPGSCEHMFCDVQPKVLANYDFAPENTEELAFRRGDIIYVLNKNDPNWWMGEIVRDNDVSRGLFPKNYVCPYSD